MTTNSCWRRLLPLLLIGLLPACGTTETLRTHNTALLARLHEGMSREEVLAVMGTEPVETTTELPPYVSVQVDHPYRQERYDVQGSEWEVLYYLTTLHRADNAITPEELTPIVLRDGVLAGWGQAYWSAQMRELDLLTR